MRGLRVWVAVVVVALIGVLAGCNSDESGGWGFRNLGKRDASNVNAQQAARPKP